MLGIARLIAWSTGPTRPGNLVSLCRYHHRSVHEGGIRIQRLDDGALRFVKPDGDPVESVAPNYGGLHDVPAGTSLRAEP